MNHAKLDQWRKKAIHDVVEGERLKKENAVLRHRAALLTMGLIMSSAANVVIIIAGILF